MSIRHLYSASGGAVLVFVMAALAPTTGQTQTPAAGDSRNQRDQITLVGCIQREADYRREHDSGRGGKLGTGAGLGNEYILVNASMAPSTMDTGAAAPCTATGTGDAYELTGSHERELERFVGRRVVITGELKNAKTDATTGRPTGGFDPMRQDLRLQEVNVASFREVASAAASASTSPASSEPVRTEAPRPRPADPDDNLPRTAGALPLVGLVGLLSLGGAVGVRSLRRRR